MFDSSSLGKSDMVLGMKKTNIQIKFALVIRIFSNPRSLALRYLVKHMMELNRTHHFNVIEHFGKIEHKFS